MFSFQSEEWPFKALYFSASGWNLGEAVGTRANMSESLLEQIVFPYWPMPGPEKPESLSLFMDLPNWVCTHTIYTSHHLSHQVINMGENNLGGVSFGTWIMFIRLILSIIPKLFVGAAFSSADCGLHVPGLDRIFLCIFMNIFFRQCLVP